MTASITAPSAAAITTASTMASSGWSCSHCPATMPKIAEYAAQVMPAAIDSGRKRRSGYPVAPAVMFTAIRPTGM